MSRAARRRKAQRSGWNVYLLHFDRPFGHARHYMGVAKDVSRRLDQHRRSATMGANLLRHVRAAGIGWRLARVWHFEGGELPARERERAWKRRGKAPLCPICKAEAGAS